MPSSSPHRGSAAPPPDYPSGSCLRPPSGGHPSRAREAPDPRSPRRSRRPYPPPDAPRHPLSENAWTARRQNIPGIPVPCSYGYSSAGQHPHFHPEDPPLRNRPRIFPAAPCSAENGTDRNSCSFHTPPHAPEASPRWRAAYSRPASPPHSADSPSPAGSSAKAPAPTGKPPSGGIGSPSRKSPAPFSEAPCAHPPAPHLPAGICTAHRRDTPPFFHPHGSVRSPRPRSRPARSASPRRVGCPAKDCPARAGNAAAPAPLPPRNNRFLRSCAPGCPVPPAPA